MRLNACVCMSGTGGAGRALLGSWLSRPQRDHPHRRPGSHSSLISKAERTGTGQGMRSESLPSSCHLAPGRCEVPARRARGRTAAGSQTDTSSPAVPLGAGPVAAPPLVGRGGPRVAAPPVEPPSPPERAPAGCDWLIQTHLQRNASLRVLVGVQFKSAAPGAQDRAGAGSEDDSCAGASPRAAVGFLKRVFGKGEKLAGAPASGPAVFSSVAPTPSFPLPHPAAA